MLTDGIKEKNVNFHYHYDPKFASTGFLLPVQLDHTPLVQIRRVFFVKSSNVGSGNKRGFHAHKLCRQLIMCTEPSITIHYRDRFGDFYEHKLEFVGDSLYLPNMTYAYQVYGPSASAMVLCDMDYDESDYIRDYDEFKRLMCER